MNWRFCDRRDAGLALAEDLRSFAGRADVIVLGLPRGGVPVAFEVARALRAPLDVFVVRKLGAPGHEELAMGAIASGGVVVTNDEVLDGLRIPWHEVEFEIERQRTELVRRELLYRGGRPPLDVRARTVILVDDGLATGSTMRAAVKALRKRAPAAIVVAVPTAAPSICREFQKVADGCVCAMTPEPFRAVGLWYEDFKQTTDQEVCDLLSHQTAASDLEGADASLPEISNPDQTLTR
jgi:predicted phosphoribosyltransferase